MSSEQFQMKTLREAHVLGTKPPSKSDIRAMEEMHQRYVQAHNLTFPAHLPRDVHLLHLPEALIFELVGALDLKILDVKNIYDLDLPEGYVLQVYYIKQKYLRGKECERLGFLLPKASFEASFGMRQEDLLRRLLQEYAALPEGIGTSRFGVENYVKYSAGFDPLLLRYIRPDKFSPGRMEHMELARMCWAPIPGPQDLLEYARYEFDIDTSQFERANLFKKHPMYRTVSITLDLEMLNGLILARHIYDLDDKVFSALSRFRTMTRGVLDAYRTPTPYSEQALLADMETVEKFFRVLDTHQRFGFNALTQEEQQIYDSALDYRSDVQRSMMRRYPFLALSMAHRGGNMLHEIDVRTFFYNTDVKLHFLDDPVAKQRSIGNALNELLPF